LVSVAELAGTRAAALAALAGPAAVIAEGAAPATVALLAGAGPAAELRGAPELLLPEEDTFLHKAGFVVFEPQATGAGIPTGADAGSVGGGGDSAESHKIAVATSIRPAARSKALVTAAVSKPISHSC